MTSRVLRALVVDDSTLNRNEVMLCLSGMDDVEVVGLAASGAEALRLAPQLKPDFITLDLLMPGIDGFSVLRIVPTLWQCPILVLSGSTGSREVFRALELGALDFIAKPETSAERLRLLPAVLREKLDVIRSLGANPQNLPPSAPLPLRSSSATAFAENKPISSGAVPRRLIAIAASTGGPAAITRLLSGLDPALDFAVVIAQHMPDKFTHAFAERLDRQLALTVVETTDGQRIERGQVHICPGRQCMEVTGQQQAIHSKLCPPRQSDRYVPSADRLLFSTAEVAGQRAIGIVLTGMGNDGLLGARHLSETGGAVIAESSASAIVYGMPRAVIDAGLARRALPLCEMASYVNDLMRPQ